MAVLGSILGCEGVSQSEVHRDVDVGDHPSQLALPHVAVGVDEARHHDEASGVDDVRPLTLEVWAHTDDRVAVDEDIASREVANLWVHRDDTAVGDSDQAARIRRQGGRAAIGWRLGRSRFR